MLNQIISVHRAKHPDGSGTALDVPFADVGLTKERATGMMPMLLQKEDASGNVQSASLDESISIDIANERVTISEGADGFTADEVYTFALVTPQGVVTGTARS